MKFPNLPEAERLRRLAPPQGRVRMVLDTDTYNEIDDQFAVVYALLSPERIDVQAIHAAPFFNDRSTGPADGVKKSYEEILRLLERLGHPHDGFAFMGAEGFLPGREAACASEAAYNLVRLAMCSEGDPLYVATIGAPTNVASAILIEPEIIERIVVVWLAGEPLHFPSAAEFNLRQDLLASQLLFDCGVPLVQIPCHGVASHLLTTLSELEQYVAGRGAIGDYLLEIFGAYHRGEGAYAKEIWDISTIAWLIEAAWVPSEIVHSPILSDQVTWSVDHSRHFIRTATFIHRNPIFNDFFRKLAAAGK